MNPHTAHMLGKQEIVAALKALCDAKETTQVEIAKVIGVDRPRISELFKDKRDLTADEAKKLVDHYRIADPVTFNLFALKAILRGIIEERVLPRVSDQELEELAGALQHLLRRLSSNPKLAENLDALTEVARAAVSRPDLSTRG